MNHPHLRPGQRVILKPSGLMGFVETLEDDGNAPSFVFDHTTRRERVYLADHDRYRAVFSPAEAAEVERRLVEAAAIPELAGPVPASRASDVSRRIELYFAGTEAQQMAAFATVLDWAIEAKARGETHGLWRGRLSWAQDYLLGELAWVSGMSSDAYEARLLALRAASTTRTAVVAAPSEPSPPIATLDFYPDEGLHALGVIDVEHDLLVTQDTFETDAKAVEDGGFVEARPGRWHVYVHVVDTPVTPGLEAAITHRARERAEELLEALSALETKWLVLVHEDALELAAEPPRFVFDTGTSDDAVARRLVGADDPDDAIASMGRGVRTKRGECVVLHEIGACEVQGGELGIFAEGPSTETSHALEYHRPDGTGVWPWGVIHRLGGDGLVPVYGVPSGPRDILVIPA